MNQLIAFLLVYINTLKEIVYAVLADKVEDVNLVNNSILTTIATCHTVMDVFAVYLYFHMSQTKNW